MIKRKVLMVAFFPNAVADFLLAPYALKAYVSQFDEICEDYDIEIVNYNIKKNIDKALKKVKSEHYDLLAFSCYAWNIDHVIALSKAADDMIPIIFGGPEISENNLDIFKGINNEKYAIVGEGEKSFKDLLMYYAGRKSDFKFSIEKGNLHIIGLTDEDEMLDLGTLPSVYQETFPNELIRFREVLVETQRGCLYRCAYCNGNKGFKKIRYFPLERVYYDLEKIIENDPSEIRFIDSMFASDKDRAKQILNFLLVHRSNSNPLIYIEGDVFTIDEPLIDLICRYKEYPHINNCNVMLPKDSPQYFTDMLQHYNLITVIGIQSLNKESMQSIRRRYLSSERFCEFMKYSNSRNILLKLDVILGLPFESMETYFEGLDTIVGQLQNADHFVAIYVLKVIPNTRLMEEYKKFELEFNAHTHNVIATNAMDSEQFYYAKCITAILFRLINSPLRNVFIEKCRELEIGYTEFAKKFYEDMKKQDMIPEKMKDKEFDDYYWHYLIFGDYKHDFMLQYIQNVHNKGL